MNPSESDLLRSLLLQHLSHISTAHTAQPSYRRTQSYCLKHCLQSEKTSMLTNSRKVHLTLTFTNLIEWFITRQKEAKHKNNWLGWFNKVSKSKAWICFHTLGKYSLIMTGVGEEGRSNKVDLIQGTGEN